MIPLSEGDIVVFRFPGANGTVGKYRPALVIAKTPGRFDDWLLCMISRQLRHYVEGCDEIIRREDDDFADTQLKVESLIRASRLLVVSRSSIEGSIGRISRPRLNRVRQNIVKWIQSTS
jgi:mRNA interferase MazF